MSDDGASQASERASSPAQTAAAAEGVTHTDACTAVSQTNIPQMTTSSVPQTEGNKWSCEVCTYENFPLSKKCTMCRAPRPTVGEDIFKLQADEASALPVSTHHIDSGAEAVTERLKPLRISSPHSHSPAQSSDTSYVKWPCPTCTYENWPKSIKCAMCGAAWPGAEAGASPPSNTHVQKEKVSLQDLRQEKDNMTQRVRTNVDLLWLQACLGVVEGCQRSVDAYLAAGGDPARVLTEQEVALLNRASAFDAGHTLVHLAIRFHRQDILSSLLARISGSGPGLKRSPSYRAPELAAAIRRHLAGCVRHKKGAFPATYLNEFCTFSLPAEISELPGAIQEQLFDELLDHDAQTQLEQDGALNCSAVWSRLLALWNRSAGDCLPDALAQACYGVFDRHNVLRRALADTLSVCARAFHERWLAREVRDAHALRYQPADAALRADWARLRQAASTTHAPLHQLHVFVLAHVMRRPIIVYGVNVVRSFRGEPLGFARFRGIYLPLLWEPDFCSKSPLCVGYTRGHFSALVTVRSRRQHPYICPERSVEESDDVAYLPLTDADGKLLPVPFLLPDEEGSEEALVRRWTCCVGGAPDAAGAGAGAGAGPGGGALAARQTLHARPLLVAQMTEEWLNHYRRLAQQTRGPFPPRLHLAPADLSSDPDTDDE